MAHASLLDVFNAGARTLSQGLDLITKQQQFELDTRAMEEEAELNQLQDRLVWEYVNPQAASPYRSNPQQYANYVRQQLAAWRQDAGRRGNDSPYYNNLLEKLQLKAQENMGEKLLAAEIQTAGQRAANDFSSRLNVIINNETTEQGIIEKGFEAVDAFESLYNLHGPKETQAYVDQVREAALQKAVEFAPTAITTDAEINRFYDSLAREKLREAPPGEDRSTYASLPNARNSIETARKAALEAKQAAWFNALKSKNDDYLLTVRSYQEAVASGDPGAMQAARIAMERAYGAGLPDWEAARGKLKSEYSPDDESKIMFMFPAPPGDEREGGGGGGGRGRADETAMENLVKNNLLYYIDAGIAGRFSGEGGLPSMYAAREAFRNETVRELREKFNYQGNVQDFEKEFYETVGKFWETAQKRLTPELQGVLTRAQEYTRRIFQEVELRGDNDLFKDFPGLAASLIGETEEFVLDLLWSNDLSQVSRSVVEKRIDSFVAAQTAKELDILRKNPKTEELNFKASGIDATGDRALAQATHAMQNPDVLWTDAQGRERYLAGTREGIAEVEKAQRTRLAEVLGVGRSQDIQSTASPGQDEYDKDATRVYTHNGKRYRFYSEDGESYVIQTEKPDGSGWDFDNPVAGSREESLREERKEAKEERKQMEEERYAELQELANSAVDFDFAPKGISLPDWRFRNAQQKLAYLQDLRNRDLEAYEAFKQAIERMGGRP
jgi:hypothetical protein